ncbi:aa3-type cytochrome c oxidase subunit IV [uncultured Nisaea sp.]|jgi:Bacterial aa3 type cytochrome c oxidase subunit IV|tara:strand:- start:798 stop:935 length:138 start_codon:yes stop_codon:yes gene_type:complete
MAASNGSTDSNYPEYKSNYEWFASMLKWSTIGVVVLLILMAIFLV